MSAREQLKPACRTYLRRLSAAALSQMALFPHLFSLRDLLLESNDTIKYVTSSSRLFITEIADSAFALASSSNTRSWYQDQVSKLREPAPHSLLLEDPHKSSLHLVQKAIATTPIILRTKRPIKRPRPLLLSLSSDTILHIPLPKDTPRQRIFDRLE